MYIIFTVYIVVIIQTTPPPPPPPKVDQTYLKEIGHFSSVLSTANINHSLQTEPQVQLSPSPMGKETLENVVNRL